jgi:hypothetical protein
MSGIDGSISLLEHDNELATKRWKQDIAAHHYDRRGLNRALALAVPLLLISFTVFLVLYLQWVSAFKALRSKVTEISDSVMVARPERDLKFELHPEDHVSRDPGIRHFSWNITKATIAPNGVQKDVFLINGM